MQYERRVKKFAHPCNGGKVSIEQLMQAFKGTHVFDALCNPKSVVYKLINSPFFKELNMTHVKKNKDWFRSQKKLIQTKESDDDSADEDIKMTPYPIPRISTARDG